MVNKIPIAVLVFLITLSFDSNGALSGYVKSLNLNSKTILIDPDYVEASINRVRTTYRDRFNNTNLWISYDVEYRTGSYFDNYQNELMTQLAPDTYWELERTWRYNDNERFHGLYRAYIKHSVNNSDLRVGRQQINWSKSFLWSSVDRFNAYNPLQLEPEERRGVDAFQWIVNRGNGDMLEGVYVFGHDSNQKAGGLRYRTHLKNTDFEYVLADFGDVYAVGITSAGQLIDAGWRLEITENKHNNPTTIQKKRFKDIVASLDYTFPGQLTLILEALYRGDGATTSSRYQWQELFALKRVNLAKHYAGLTLRKGFGPIFSSDLVYLENLDDQSNVLMPTLSYSLPEFEDVSLKIGGQLFSGESNTEYGSFNDLVYGEIQWFF